MVFHASGGQPAYRYSATGLPPGLTINANSGLVNGQPQRAGWYTITITATDAAGATGSQNFNLSIA
jgi:hypothetical protein